jgi:hypothetical protein
MSEYTDATLHRIRATYASETAWAPAHASGELRQIRAARLDMQTAITRARAEAATARGDGDHPRAARHDALERSAQAAAAFYLQREHLDQDLATDRTEWENMTAGSRHLAVLAEAELRRRHPETFLQPLISAEPEPLLDQLPAITDMDVAARG